MKQMLVLAAPPPNRFLNRYICRFKCAVSALRGTTAKFLLNSLVWCQSLKDACSLIHLHSKQLEMFVPTAPNSQRSERGLERHCDHAGNLSAACADLQDTAQGKEWLHEMTAFVNGLLAGGLLVRTKRFAPLIRSSYHMLSVFEGSLLVREVKASRSNAIALQDVAAVTRDGAKVTIFVAKKQQLLSSKHKTFECDSETTAVLLQCALNAFKG
jgi:hypothetical protein